MAFDTTIPLSIQWNKQMLNAIKYVHASLPVAARALAMMHTAMYNAWSAYDNDARSTDTAFYFKFKGNRSFVKNHKQKAFSYAAYRVLTELFWFQMPADKKDVFRELMGACGYDPDDTSLDVTLPQGIGNLAAKLVIEYRTGDGSNSRGTLHDGSWSDYTGYSAVNTHDKMVDIDYWQPIGNKTPSGAFRQQKFLVPHWGLVKSFSMNDNGQFRPAPPYHKNQSQFIQQAKHILDLSAKLDDKQKAIAEYWSDDWGKNTLPTRWCDIAQFVATSKKYQNDDCIKLFFALGNALLDASIAAWECKRHYDTARPITVIRELFKGKEVQAWAGPNKNHRSIKGEEWMPYLATPASPEYISAQSTLSRVAAMILQRYTGSDQFRGYTVIEKGASQIEKGLAPKIDVTLEWASFTEAANEAAMARMYGGLHFTRSVEEGKHLGEAVGECVWKTVLFYFND